MEVAVVQVRIQRAIVSGKVTYMYNISMLLLNQVEPIL